MLLNDDTIRSISKAKKEPGWMLKRRLEAYAQFVQLPMHRFGPDLSGLRLEEVEWYVHGPQKKKSWDDVDPEIRQKFEKLGVPEAERKFLAGLEAQVESEAVYGKLKKEWEKKGVIFTNMDEAVKKHSGLLRKHLGNAISSSDNKFAALTDAVWSGGSFLFVPRGVALQAPLHAYFMISKEGIGQFERTVIIAETGSSVTYVEGCFTKGTSVETSSGQKAIESISQGDGVLTHRGRFCKVSGIQRRQYDGNLYSIKFYGDNTVVLNTTEEHPFLCVRREKKNEKNKGWKQEWIKASELKRMDYLVIPIIKETDSRSHRKFTVRWRKGITTKKVKIDEGFSTLVGYYLSEGSIADGEHYVHFSFGIHEKEKIEEVLRLLKVVFPDEYAINLMYHEKNHGLSIVVNSSAIARVFSQFGRGAGNKFVPEWMMKESDRNQAAMIRSLFMGDGNYLKKQTKTGLKEAFRICTVSKKLAHQTRDILLRLGIFASINVQDRSAQGKQSMYYLIIGGAFLKKFGEIVGVECEDLKPKGQKRASNFHIEGKYAYVPIREIRVSRVKDMPVYNFSVEGDESYTAGSVVVHNCSAPLYPRSNLHTGVVEIFAEKNAHVRYITLQNWSKNVYNLVTQRGIAKENATIEWIDANLGSLCTQKYPCVVLAGDGAKGKVTSISAASAEQNLDSGGRMIHLAPNTSSSIISKGISSKGGSATFRAEVKIVPEAKGSGSFVKCQGIMLDDISKNNSLPKFFVENGDSFISHEASAGKLSEKKLFYLMSRGISRKDAEELLVLGFFDSFIKELPFEYAVEFNRLLRVEIEGGAI